MRTACVIMLMLFLFLTGFVFGEKVATLPELVNPSSFAHPIYVDEDNIFITDGIKVLIYSTKNYKLKKMFGKPGEGPGEFIGSDGGKAVTATVTQKNIVVSSVNRISYFTKGGKFIREIKTSNGFIFITFADKFVGNTFITENKNTFAGLNFFDAEFNKIKELARSSQFSLRTKFSPFFIHRAKPIVYKGKLYVNNPNTGIIDLYDYEAKKLKSLTYDFEKVKITEIDKETIMGFYKDDVRIKQFFNQVKKLITFPVYFPMIKTYHISDNKLYILTYKREGKNSEFIILDINGKFIKKVMFPLSDVNFLETCPYTIFKGKIYQLILDEDSDQWELHIDELK